MKLVTPLADAEHLTLRDARDQGPTAARRRRAQAVERSRRGYRRTALADLLNGHGETASGWLNLWETSGLRGLSEQPRCGRPPRFTPAEAEQGRIEVEQPPASDGRSRRGGRTDWGKPPADKPGAGS